MQDWQQRVEKWAEDRNLIKGSSPERQMEKLEEEFNELDEAIRSGTGLYPDEVKDAIGDMSVVLCLIAKMAGHSYEDCLEHAWEQIKDRKGEVRDGVFVKEEDL